MRLAGVVELVDTGDLKSPGPKRLYGFKSRLRYNVSLSVQRPGAVPRIAGPNAAGLEPSERRPEGGTAARDGGDSERGGLEARGRMPSGGRKSRLRQHESLGAQASDS